MSVTMDFALVNQTTNIVENIIVLEEGITWTPPDGVTLVPLVRSFGIGDTWDGSSFIRASEPPEPEVGAQPTSTGTQTL